MNVLSLVELEQTCDFLRRADRRVSFFGCGSQPTGKLGGGKDGGKRAEEDGLLLLRRCKEGETHEGLFANYDGGGMVGRKHSNFRLLSSERRSNILLWSDYIHKY